MTDPPGAREFDGYADDYDAALARGLDATGEKKDYFARGRAAWLAQCLRKLTEEPGLVMDFGCGTGSATPFLLDLAGVRKLIGVDVSKKSVEIARRNFGSDRALFFQLDDYEPDEQVDLVFCNGVFHHIRPAKRPAMIQYAYNSLRCGGLFAFWENNPWNPGTRYVMSRVPFDREAIMISAPEARRLLASCGFQVLRTDFHFIFPRVLSVLRRLEAPLSRFPLGGQYQVLCRKPYPGNQN